MALGEEMVICFFLLSILLGVLVKVSQDVTGREV